MAAQQGKFVYRPSHKEIICNHYKFKSREDYSERTRLLNDTGFMAGKFTHPKMNEWMKDANVAVREDILRYVPRVRESIIRGLPEAKCVATHNLSIVCMVRAEERYIDEWIHFNLINEVDHFFIYNNDNRESFSRKLDIYKDLGYVTLLHWPDYVLNVVPEYQRRTMWGGIVGYDKISTQNLAFVHFNETYKNLTNWVMKVDVDEYVFPLHHKTLCQYLAPLDNIKGVEIERFDFGSSDFDARPRGLIIENYRKSQKEHRYFKSIARTKYIHKNDPGNAHYFMYV